MRSVNWKTFDRFCFNLWMAFWAALWVTAIVAILHGILWSLGFSAGDATMSDFLDFAIGAFLGAFVMVDLKRRENDK